MTTEQKIDKYLERETPKEVIRNALLALYSMDRIDFDCNGNPYWDYLGGEKPLESGIELKF